MEWHGTVAEIHFRIAICWHRAKLCLCVRECLCVMLNRISFRIPTTNKLSAICLIVMPWEIDTKYAVCCGRTRYTVYVHTWMRCVQCIINGALGRSPPSASLHSRSRSHIQKLYPHIVVVNIRSLFFSSPFHTVVLYMSPISNIKRYECVPSMWIIILTVCLIRSISKNSSSLHK